MQGVEPRSNTAGKPRRISITQDVDGAKTAMLLDLATGNTIIPSGIYSHINYSDN